jgi:hypothetical protein
MYLMQAQILPLEFVCFELIRIFQRLSNQGLKGFILKIYFYLLKFIFHISLLKSCVTSKQDTSGQLQVDMSIPCSTAWR